MAAPPSAPAAAPVTPAAAPAPAAAPQTKGGFLDHIKVPASSPADNTQAPRPAPAAQAAGQTPTPAPQPAAPATPTVFKATIRGKEYTGEELAKAYENSFEGALKLNDNYKATQAKATALEAKLAEMEAKVLETPPFKILTKEEIKELDPADQTEYIIKKNAWETQRDARKEQLAKVQEQTKAGEAETKQYIYSRTQCMIDSPDKFPGYKDLIPVMEQVLDSMPVLGGRRETPDLLYYVALGLQKDKERTVSMSAEEKARQEAAATAAAQAAANGSGNPPAPVVTQGQDDDSDEAFQKRILQAAPGRMFRT